MDELGPMFGIYSSGPSLPWLWIIEYVSSFPDIDSSIIRGLIEAAPVLPGDLGKNASERVALRCLEELFGPQSGLENVAPPDSRVTFDLSSSCVDVLEHIVRKVSLSNLKKAGPELLRWDVQPFIMHKRASLPKCALEQLKGSNLEKFLVPDGDENGYQEGEGDQDLHVASRTTEQSNAVGDVELKEDQMENVQNADADVRVEQRYGDRPCENVVMDEPYYVANGSLQKGHTGYAGKNIDQGFPLSSPNSTSAGGLQQNIDPGEAKADMEHPGDVELKDNQMEKVQNADAGIRVEQRYRDRPCQNVVMNEPNYVENGALQEGHSSYAGENFDQGFPLSSPNSTSADGLRQNIDPGEAKADTEHLGDVELKDNQMENFQNADADVRVEQRYGDRPCQNLVMDEPNCVQNRTLQEGHSGYAGENIDQVFPLSSPNSTSADGFQQDVDPGEAKADMEHPGDVELKDNQMENVQNADADIRIDQRYGDKPCQNVVMDEPNYVENGALQEGHSSYAGENIDHGFPLSSSNSTSADELLQNIDPGEAKADMEHPGGVEMKENQMENVQNADSNVRVEQRYGDRPCENVVMNEPYYVANGSLQKGHTGYAGETVDQGFPLSSPNSTSADGLQQNIDPGEAKADMEHPCAEQVCENKDVRVDIALKKSLFLSSLCRPSQGPAGKAGWTGQNLCVKCNKNGQVLFCSSSGCPLVVHESCLGSAARYEDKGNFYCPFCAYSLFISKYLEAKDKTSLARKELPAFMELFSQKLTEEQRKLQTHSNLNGEELDITLESGHLIEKEHDYISQNREANHGPASCPNGNKLCAEDETSMSGAVDVQGENNEGEEKVGLADRSMKENEEVLLAKLKYRDDNPTNENIETVHANQVEDEGDFVKEALKPQVTDQPKKPACSLNLAGEESSANENDKLIISSYSLRSGKHETSSFLPSPKSKRKKVPWTKDEEEMLRQGVQKFANHGNNVPWKKILDFGTKVFLRDRTAADLKDKWKNMHRGRQRCEGGDATAQ